MFWLRTCGVVDGRPTYSMETSASRLLPSMQSGKHRATRNALETPLRMPRLLPAALAKIWCDDGSTQWKHDPTSSALLASLEAAAHDSSKNLGGSQAANVRALMIRTWFWGLLKTLNPHSSPLSLSNPLRIPLKGTLFYFPKGPCIQTDILWP